MQIDIYDAITKVLKESWDLRDVEFVDPGDWTIEPGPMIREGMTATVEYDGCKHPVTYKVIPKSK